MRIIKLAVISFIIFFLVITGISLFIPSHIRISKAIYINAAKETVLEQIKDPLKWKNWYPGTDSLEIYYVNGIAKGVILDRSQRLIAITNINDTTVVAATAGRGFRKNIIGWNVILNTNSNTSSVEWYMDFHLHWYPWEKFRSLLFDKLYGSQMEKGLANLKELLEK